MPATSTYTPSSDAYIKGVQGDIKWGVSSLTYSFPTSASFYGANYGSGEPGSNFGAFDAAQQTAVRSVLAQYSSVANLTFTQVTESASLHGDLRYAFSDAPSVAWAYFPTTAAEGGDSWFNKSSGYFTDTRKGEYTYTTMLHETGHALGLEHAHEHFVMPADKDSMEYTVMSYRSYVGASTTYGYTNEIGGYAQSLMMYDIAALQHMYGANFTSNSGATVYTWSPTTGEAYINGVGQGAPAANRVFQTIWDGGGVDTYDFSSYSTNLKVDLAPGGWTTTSATQLAKLHYDGSKVAVGNIANALQYQGDVRSLIENATGGSGADVITGNQIANVLKGAAGADRLTGAGGDDTLDGGDGADVAVYSGARANYLVTLQSDGSLRVVDTRTGSADGADIVRGVETFQFSDAAYTQQALLGSVQPLPPTTPTPPTAPTTPTGLTLVGDAAANTLTGGSGDDTLDGKAGADKLYGGEGVDILIGGGGADRLDGGAGLDTASYATATTAVAANLKTPSSNTGDAKGDTYFGIENLLGGAFADSLTGDDAINILQGGAGADRLTGNGGADTLRGDDGADILIGGAGADALYGGAGNDVFTFQKLADTTAAARDTIFDFAAGDKIDLRSIDAATNRYGDQAFTFIGATGFTGKAGQLNVIDGVVSGDVNGDRLADFQINVVNTASLSASDFYL